MLVIEPINPCAALAKCPVFSDLLDVGAPTPAVVICLVLGQTRPMSRHGSRARFFRPARCARALTRGDALKACPLHASAPTGFAALHPPCTRPPDACILGDPHRPSPSLHSSRRVRQDRLTRQQRGGHAASAILFCAPNLSHDTHASSLRMLTRPMSRHDSKARFFRPASCARALTRGDALTTCPLHASAPTGFAAL